MTRESVSHTRAQTDSPAVRLTLSAVICTRDRPDVLRDTLDTVWRQSRKPDELVIVDDGQLDIEWIAENAQRDGITFVYHNKSDRPGLAKSRRAGIEQSSGDIVLFLDDDVLLDEEYIEAIMAVYERDGAGDIGGCTGTLQGFRYRPFQMLLLRFFGMDAPKREGQVLNNFLGVLVRNIERPIDVQWLAGCNMSYRREAIEAIEIPEALEDYSQGEDRVISWLVGQRRRLVATPDARLVHRRVTGSRIDNRKRGFQEVHYNYLHWLRHMPRDLRHRAAIAWLCVGYATINLLRLDWNRAAGNLDGIARILLGRRRPNDTEAPGNETDR